MGVVFYRLQWQKIKAIQMFTEHVLLNHDNMIIYARRLNLVSRLLPVEPILPTYICILFFRCWVMKQTFYNVPLLNLSNVHLITCIAS